MVLVSICIATYKRPDKLSRLLDSIDKHCCSDQNVEIVVVDNDALESATSVLNRYEESGAFPLKRGTQIKQNISLTRNACVALASGEFVLFVDDDEFVEVGWLDQHLATASQFEADVVFGPVLTIYPENTPKWIVEGDFFGRKRFKTGETRAWGGTGNTLVRASIFNQERYSFNPHFGLSGGEDIQLFYNLHKAGKKLVWCDEALAFEDVEESRLSERWLIKRGFSSGQRFSRVVLQGVSLSVKLRTAAIQLAGFLALLLALPWYGANGKIARVKCLQKLAVRAGRLAYVRSLVRQEYKAG